MVLLKWFRRFFKPKILPFDKEEIESKLGYHFNNSSILFTSLKHRSYSQSVDGDVKLSNERFEFLGDSILNMMVSHRIFKENPDFQEGDLTKLKSNLVSKKSAAIAAKNIGLDRFILLNDSEENAGGRNRTSIIADAFEAVVCAIFLDGGYEASEKFIKRTIFKSKDVLLNAKQTNHKSMLLELVQSEKLGSLVYRTISESGPEHDKIFTVEVFLNSQSIGKGTGKTKKTAQQMSAKQGLSKVAEIIQSRG